MEWVEITARTVREATDQALDQLGVDESDAEVDVVEEPRPGLFGRTRGQARVRARVVPRPHPPKQERRDRKRSSSRGGRDGANGGGSKAGSGSGSSSGEAAADAAVAETSSDEPSAARSGTRRRRRGGGGGGDRPRSQADRAERSTDTESADRPRQGDDVDTEILPFDEHVTTVKDFLEGLVDAFGADATVDVVEVDEETREVQVNGSDLGLLIGPRGLTLQAVGELARTVVYRKAPDGQEGRVRIDIGGYRERRREALISFAQRIAADVVESGRAKALEPMAPPDRKVVHDTINDIDGVHTTSEGAEPRRRVVVVPD